MTERADTPENTTDESQNLSPEVAARLARMRAQVRENFGKVVMALVALPRYRHHSIADLQHLVLEPLMHDRIALAYPSADTDDLTDLTGIAIWANVSEEVNEKVREQVRAGVFPVRLRPDEWNSGNINWLFDVIAEDKAATARVLANFRQVVKTGELHLHPMIAGLVDDETLALLRGASRAPEPEAGDAT